MVEKKDKSKSSLLSWVGFFLFLLIIFFIFRFAIEITVVSGESMNPTLDDGEVLFTNKFIYNEGRGDIVIFEHDGGFYTVKRVIGLPGETLEINDGVVYINNEPLEEEYIQGASNDLDEILIPENHYFLIGDNREPGASQDSRNDTIGPVSVEKIKGKVHFSIWPIGTF